MWCKTGCVFLCSLHTREGLNTALLTNLGISMRSTEIITSSVCLFWKHTKVVFVVIQKCVCTCACICVFKGNVGAGEDIDGALRDLSPSQSDKHFPTYAAFNRAPQHLLLHSVHICFLLSAGKQIYFSVTFCIKVVIKRLWKSMASFLWDFQ